MSYYLYHAVPENMEGSVLHPLNVLKDKYPVIYQQAVKKYKGREEVMQSTIPVLNCLWNDVLHLSPVHPALIRDAFRELGQVTNPRVYQIDADLLEPEKTIIYLHKYSDREERMRTDNWQSYSPEKIGQLQELPQRTKDYYKTQFESGQRPLVFAWVPHVLYKGSIDISGCPILS